MRFMCIGGRLATGWRAHLIVDTAWDCRVRGPAAYPKRGDDRQVVLWEEWMYTLSGCAPNEAKKAVAEALNAAPLTDAPPPAAASTVAGIYAEHRRVEAALQRKRDDERITQLGALAQRVAERRSRVDGA
eukprot:gene26162-25161_t